MECDSSLNSTFRNYAEFFREKSHTFKRRYSEGLSLYFWFQRLPENNIEHSKQNWTFCHCNDIGSNKTYCCCVFLHIVLRALGKHSDWVCHRSWIYGDAIFKMTCANACERWETKKWLLVSRLQFYSFFCLISSAKNTTDQLLRINRLPPFALNFMSQSPASLLSGDETCCYLFCESKAFILLLVQTTWSKSTLAIVVWIWQQKIVSVFRYEEAVNTCVDSHSPCERHQLKP